MYADSAFRTPDSYFCIFLTRRRRNPQRGPPELDQGDALPAQRVRVPAHEGPSSPYSSILLPFYPHPLSLPRPCTLALSPILPSPVPTPSSSSLPLPPLPSLPCQTNMHLRRPKAPQSAPTPPPGCTNSSSPPQARPLTCSGGSTCPRRGAARLRWRRRGEGVGKKEREGRR